MLQGRHPVAYMEQTQMGTRQCLLCLAYAIDSKCYYLIRFTICLLQNANNRNGVFHYMMTISSWSQTYLMTKKKVRRYDQAMTS